VAAPGTTTPGIAGFSTATGTSLATATRTMVFGLSFPQAH